MVRRTPHRSQLEWNPPWDGMEPSMGWNGTLHGMEWSGLALRILRIELLILVAGGVGVFHDQPRPEMIISHTEVLARRMRSPCDGGESVASRQTAIIRSK